MINLEKINTGSDLYTWSEKLWLDSFPEIERRDTALQRLNTDTCPIFNYNVAISENRPVGLFTYWDFEKFIYCEHFATDKSLRGKGYGSEILKKSFPKPANRWFWKLNTRKMKQAGDVLNFINAPASVFGKHKNMYSRPIAKAENHCRYCLWPQTDLKNRLISQK